jgi:hypothetical protein
VGAPTSRKATRAEAAARVTALARENARGAAGGVRRRHVVCAGEGRQPA